MNIIFGDAADTVPDNFTKLELDTIRTQGKTVVAYCLVDHIPLSEFPQVDSNRDLHNNLIKEYKNRNWKYCLDAIEHLKGAWNGEVDTFYDNLKHRIEQHQVTVLSEDWDGVVDR